MKKIWIFILFLAISCQLSAVSGSQVFSFSDSQIQYYESQIRLADSLYKNYLPQYNFEEVKAAMEFFDSVQLSAISRQHRGLFDKKDTDENKLIAESRLLTAAKAHYYHAVGLTERDDIVGACEHYFIALEIMETETENLKTSKSGKGSEPRAMSNEPFLESEKSVNISEICGNEKTNHRLVQKKSEKGCEPRAMSNEPFLESEKSVNISEICGNEKTNHRLVQKKSEESCEQRAMSNEPFFESENLKTSESEKGSEQQTISNESFLESEKSVNISEICGNEKTNHRLVQKKSEESCEPRAMSNEQRFRKAHSSQLEAQSPSQVFRGVGILRARFYIGFTNLVYNMCRLVQIKRYHPDWIIN